MGDRERREPGKVLSLAALLDEHSEDIEADLRRYYQVDLLDLYRGRLSYRRLGIFIERLPAESWLRTTLRDSPDAEPAQDGRHGPWALEHYLLAHLVDAVRDVRYVTAVAGQITPAPTPPHPLERPGAKPKGLNAAQIAYLDALFDRKEPDA